MGQHAAQQVYVRLHTRHESTKIKSLQQIYIT